jgi:hypothetical protein
MPEPDEPPAPAGDDEATAAADSGEPEAFAVSPAVGPVPAIYVPQSPSEPSATDLLWQAEAQLARQARSWAACHPPHHGSDCEAHESAAPMTCPPCRRRTLIWLPEAAFADAFAPNASPQEQAILAAVQRPLDVPASASRSSGPCGKTAPAGSWSPSTTA